MTLISHLHANSIFGEEHATMTCFFIDNGFTKIIEERLILHKIEINLDEIKD